MYSTLFYIVLSVFLTALPRESRAVPCAGSAKYKLTFNADWTAETHPEDFPASNNPHFSSLIGCTHKAAYNMWKPGKLASTGVKNVAEKGTTNAIVAEMNLQIASKNASKIFTGPGISNVGAVTANDLETTSDYPLVSAISMIAPSPDWFVGVHDYSLCDEATGKWFDQRVRNLSLYDSGTDSAKRFVHADTPTVPPVAVFLITKDEEGSLKSNNTIKPFGTFTFVKTYDSSSENQNNTSSTPRPESTASTTPKNTAYYMSLQYVYGLLTLLVVIMVTNL